MFQYVHTYIHTYIHTYVRVYRIKLLRGMLAGPANCIVALFRHPTASAPGATKPGLPELAAARLGKACAAVGHWACYTLLQNLN